MSSSASTHIQFTFALLVSALIVSGCSSSSDSNTGTTGLADASTSGTTSEFVNSTNDTSIDTSNNTSVDTSVGSGTEPSTGDSGLEGLETTRVDFDINVPVFVSDALQVRLVWGDKDITASWVTDESWAISEDFPTNTENQLEVTFNDENGAITLASLETTFVTGMNSSQSFKISADQFNTALWDDDNDGVSNLDELNAGTNPSGDDLLQPVEPVLATLELVQNKTFRISWQDAADAQFYRVLENPDKVSGFTRISDDLDSTTNVYNHRVALYEKFNASYIVQSCNASGCVDSEELVVAGTLEQAIGYIKASNTDGDDRFGYEVSLSADGNTLAVGAIGEAGAVSGINGDQTDNSDSYTGAVYLFVKQDGDWQQQAYLKADIPDAFYFGTNLSLSGNGKTLAVLERTRNGGIYIFQSDNGNWQQQIYLPATVLNESDRFRGSLNLSSDGNTLIVTSENSVYVFERSGADWWRQQAYLTPDNIGEKGVGAGFGFKASLSSDGNTLAVSATSDSSSATGIDGDTNGERVAGSGAVFVYIRSNGAWQQQAYIKASITDEEDSFGGGLTLSGDGNTLAVGAGFEDSSSTGVNGDQNDNNGDRTGAVYMFFRDNGRWQEQAFLKASNADEVDIFGRDSMSLSADGNTLAVGLWTENSAATGVNGDQSDNSVLYAGAVYMYKRRNGEWQSQAYLKASNTDRAGGRASFGRSVSLSADGGTLVVGADGEASAATGINGNQYDEFAGSAGAVYIY